MAVEITVHFCHVELADPSIKVDEDVSLGLGIGYCEDVMGHDFIGRVGIWGAAETSNNLPHICTIGI